MDDLYASFDKDEKDYVEILTSGAKLSTIELEAMYTRDGRAKYESDALVQRLFKNNDIKRYIADYKIKEAKRKEASKDIKLSLLMSKEKRENGVSVIEQIANTDGHKDQYNAAKFLARGDESYAAQKGKQLAESEGDLIEPKEFKWAYKLSDEE